MKKITLKFSIFLPLFLTSFFLFSFNVNADTYSFNISSDDINFLKDNLSTMVSTADNFISSDPDLSHDYFIVYLWSNYYLFVKPSTNNSYVVAYIGSTNNGPFTINANAYYGKFSSDFKEITDFNKSSLGALKAIYSKAKYFYSTYDIYFSTNTGNIYSFNYLDFSFLVNDSTNDYLPSLYNLYRTWYSDDILPSFSPPEPEDNTPILTNFYTTVGNKVGELAVNMSDNYVYLAIIGVFILIFLIELIRRYLL